MNRWDGLYYHIGSFTGVKAIKRGETVLFAISSF